MQLISYVPIKLIRSARLQDKILPKRDLRSQIESMGAQIKSNGNGWIVNYRQAVDENQELCVQLSIADAQVKVQSWQVQRTGQWGTGRQDRSLEAEIKQIGEQMMSFLDLVRAAIDAGASDIFHCRRPAAIL